MGVDSDIPWDKIGSSLMNIKRKPRARLPPVGNPYADLEISEDSQSDGDYPEGRPHHERDSPELYETGIEGTTDEEVEIQTGSE